MDIKCFITCWAIAFLFLRNFRRKDNQQQWLHSQNTWNKVEPCSNTKRKKLSEVTNLFDPLGWLSTTKIQFKSFLQVLWMLKLIWDETLLLRFLEHYGRFRHQFKELEKIKLERRVFAAPFSSYLEIHVFVTPQPQHGPELSTRESKWTTECTQTLTAKARVSPMKPLCCSFRTLCSTSWSTIISSSEESHQGKSFSQSQCLGSDGFTSDPRLD